MTMPIPLKATEPFTQTTITNTTVSTGSGLIGMLNVHCNLLQIASQERDMRLVVRVLHNLPQIRWQLNSSILLTVVNAGIASGSCANDTFNIAVPILNAATMRVEENLSTPKELVEKFSFTSLGEKYICLLIGLYLLSQQRHVDAESILKAVISAINKENRPFYDPLLARCYYFLGRAIEAQDMLATPQNHAMLMGALCDAEIRHERESMATVYNLLLRSMVLSDQYEAAERLARRAKFPEDACSGPNQARYHYYVAVMRAVRAEYAKAKQELLHAQRKAPHVDGTNSKTKKAAGFIQSINKLLVVIELLLGEIPERSLFRRDISSKSLKPYFDLSQAVRLGDLGRFQKVVELYQAKFTADRTLVLIQRLHQNVLKAGLKRLSIAYKRIPLGDVKEKLGLASREDAEFVLLKAINDKVLPGGSINHEAGYFQSKPSNIAYYTDEPQEQLHKRITELDGLHDDCLRSMRYPLNKKNGTLAGGDGLDNGPVATEAEMIEEYMDADDDFM